MGVIQFELTRTVPAPIEDVFARLADINGHNDWMPRKGSIFRHTEQTSPGPPTVGTTYHDVTSWGPSPGEIAEFEPPHTLVFHWWDKSKTGKLKSEGWPGYSLEAAGPNATVVRHHATMHVYGVQRLATPMFRWLAVRERTATLDALVASFDPSRPPNARQGEP